MTETAATENAVAESGKVAEEIEAAAEDAVDEAPGAPIETGGVTGNREVYPNDQVESE